MAREPSVTTSSQLHGAFALLGAAVLYSSFGVLIRILETLFGDSTQVGVRFAVAALVTGGIFLAWGQRGAIKALTRRQLYYSLGLALSFSANVVCFTIAVTRTTLATSVSLLYAGGIIASLLLAITLFGERVTVMKGAAILLSIAGLAMYTGSFVALSVGAVTALAAGLFDGVSNGLRKALRGADRSVVITIQYGGGAVVALLIAMGSGERLIHAENPSFLGVAWPLIVAVGFGIALVCLGYLLFYGFAHFDLNVASVLLATEIGFAALFGLLCYGEVPSSTELAGGLLIFVAATLAVMRRASRSAKSSPTTGESPS